MDLDLERIVLFEDEDLLFINKPSGLPSQPTLDPKRENLYGLLLKTNRWTYLRMHHRLDVGTSGLILLTKSKRANPCISEGFKCRTIRKKYLCWVLGRPVKPEITVEVFLRPEKVKGQMLMKEVLSGGDYSKTEFRRLQTVLVEGQVYSLLEAELHTGRMHQIRAHCKGLGLPIVGDRLYGNRDLCEEPAFLQSNQILLHSRSLSFAHPFLEGQVLVEAPLPSEFTRFASLGL